jgi:type II secretory pathway pseudopilin PulG
MSNVFKRCVRGGRQGFTLTEVVVASALMMMSFVAVLGTISFVRRSASIAENQLACLHIARQTLEDLSQQSYDATLFAVGTRQFPHNRGHCVVSEQSDRRTKDVTVVVNWVEPSGMARSVSLTTSFSRSLHK